MLNLHISGAYKWLCFRWLMSPLNALLSVKIKPEIFYFFFEGFKMVGFEGLVVKFCFPDSEF